MRTLSDPDVVAFREEVRAWLQSAMPREWVERRDVMSEEEKLEARRQWEKILFAGGYAGITWPTEYGGRGLGPLENLAFYEEAAAVHALDELNTIGKYLAGPAIIAHGTPEQKALHLPKILAGEWIWCEGFSEPGAGSDLAAVSTTAERVGDEYRINGQKIWTSRAEVASFCYLLVRTSKELPRHHNLSLFLFDMRQPGVKTTPIRQITGEQTHFSQVFFDGARATPSQMLGKENEGWALGTLLGFRSERQAADALRRYVQMHEWFDQLRECTDETCAHPDAFERLRVRLEVLRWHIRRCVELTANGRKWYPASAVLKLYWSELMQEIATAGLELACARHLGYWRLRYLDSRASTIYGGPAQIQRNVIADRVLELTRSSRRSDRGDA